MYSFAPLFLFLFSFFCGHCVLVCSFFNYVKSWPHFNIASKKSGETKAMFT